MPAQLDLRFPLSLSSLIRYISHPCCIYLPSLLLSACWPHLLLQKAEGKGAISSHLLVLSALDPGGRLSWGTCHPRTDHHDLGLNNLIGQVPVKNPSRGWEREWISLSRYIRGREGPDTRYTRAIYCTLFTDMVLGVKI